MSCESNKYDRLVFSGGGMRGIMFVGALSAINCRHFFGATEFCGTSVGALLALMCYLDVDFCSTKAFDMLDDFIDCIMSWDQCPLLNGKQSLNSGHRVSLYFKHVLKSFTGLDNPCFADLKRIYPLKSLVVCATNTETCRAKYFSFKTTPHIHIADAVMASMCLPVLFQHQKIENCHFLDGGLTDQCPFAFDIFELFEQRKHKRVLVFEINDDSNTSPTYFTRTFNAMLAGANECNAFKHQLVKVLNKIHNTLTVESIQFKYSSAVSFAFSKDLVPVLLNEGQKIIKSIQKKQGTKFPSLLEK